jgi:hypothetical protein
MKQGLEREALQAFFVGTNAIQEAVQTHRVEFLSWS